MIRCSGFFFKNGNLKLKRAIITLTTVALLFFCSIGQLFAQTAEPIILKIILNGADKGDYFLSRTIDDDILFPVADFKKIGLSKAIVDVTPDSNDNISLKALAPQTTFEIDDKRMELKITAEPELFDKNIITFGRAKKENVTTINENSAFINYSISYDIDQDYNNTAFMIPWEFGTKLNDFFGYSSFSYKKTDDDEDSNRIMTNISKDLYSIGARLTIGDFITSQGNLGSNGNFGGISVSKNFAITPYLIKSPELGVLGILSSPSTIDIYLNDMKLRSLDLQPGEFDIQNILTRTGAGEIVLKIKDAFGREYEILIPYYLSSNLLKTGIHEYSYNVGFKREDFGYESNEYNPNINLIASHRIGLSDKFTAGMKVEADKDVVNFGSSAVFLVSSYGEVELIAAYSNERGSGSGQDKEGAAGVLSYTYSSKLFNGRLSVKSQTKEFSNLTISASNDKSQYEGSANFGISLNRFGSISTSFSVLHNYSGKDLKRTSLFYNKLLMKNISFRVTGSRIEKNNDEIFYEVFTGLNFILGNKQTGGLNYRDYDNSASVNATLQKNAPLGNGYGYTINVDSAEDTTENNWGTSGNGTFDYRGAYGIYSASYRQFTDSKSYNLKMSGSLSLINNSIYFAKPINDAFALVKVGNLKDVAIKYNNQEIGRTNSDGELLVPHLISYAENGISVLTTDLPIEYNIPETTKYVTPTYRGAGALKFYIEVLRAIEGKVYFIKGGKKIPAQYAGLEIDVFGKKKEIILGEGGVLYVENIPSGTFHARLYDKDHDCSFDIVIPESNDIIINIGEISCEVD